MENERINIIAEALVKALETNEIDITNREIVELREDNKKLRNRIELLLKHCHRMRDPERRLTTEVLSGGRIWGPPEVYGHMFTDKEELRAMSREQEEMDKEVSLFSKVYKDVASFRKHIM